MKTSLRTLVLLASVALCACSTTQVYQNPGSAYAAVAGSQVAILYSAPQQPYDVLGVVSATKYKPGWTDPSVGDAIPQLQKAGAQLGADAVLVRSSRSNNDRHTVVEGEAIRYRQRPTAPTPSPAPTSDCVACGKIGGG